MFVYFSYFAELVQIPYKWTKEDELLLTKIKDQLPQNIEQIKLQYFPSLVSTKLNEQFINSMEKSLLEHNRN